MENLNRDQLLAMLALLDILEAKLLAIKESKAPLKWCCEKFGIRFGKPTFIKAESMAPFAFPGRKPMFEPIRIINIDDYKDKK